MDIYSFINSRDIAAYCREIKKEWNPFEMAVIISRSNRPMADKHAAWRELITGYPDMPTPKNMHVDASGSLHKKLTELIAYEEQTIAQFQAAEPDATYVFDVYFYDGRGKERRKYTFNTHEDALVNISGSWDRYDVRSIEIEKYFIDDTENQKGSIAVTFDYDGSIHGFSVTDSETPEVVLWNIRDLNGAINEQLKSFYIDIPVPFKRGDILTIRITPDRCDDETVFVLDSLTRDDP